MKHLSLLLTIVLLTYFKSHAVDTTTIIYNDFSNLTSWQLNGTAKGATGTESEKVLRLTQNKTSQSGSAFIKNPIKLVSDKGFMASFSAYFAFRMSNTGGLDEGDGAGADGIVFVIQTVANNVGSVGGGLGYRGIKKSIGIEFDTWNNTDSSNDPDHNHIGVDTNGITRSIITVSEQSLFNNGKIWYAWIDYDGDNQLLEVRYDSLNNRPADPKISQKINIPSLLVVENVYVGFTSATGSSYNTNDILAFNFVNKFQPYLYSMSVSARPDTIVNVVDTVTLTATIRDMSNTIQPDSSKKAQWRIIDDGGNPLSILLNNAGSEVTLVPQVAGSVITIESRAVVYGQTLLDTITIHVNEEQKFSLDITATPDTNVKSHDTVQLKAVVFDSKNRQVPDSEYKTKWEIIVHDGNPDDILKSTSGAQVTCIPEVAFTTVSIVASVLIKNILITDTIRLHVRAGDPYRLSIEKRPFSRQSGISLDTIKLTTEMNTDSVFAVVRDKWGALCSVADSLLTKWVVVSGQQVAMATGIDNRKYIGYLERMGSAGYAVVEVSQGQLIKDSVVVRVSGAPYLVRAVYIAPGDGTSKKTMKLYFSEDVNCSMLNVALPLNTLAYKNSAGQMTKNILDGAVYQSGTSEQFAKEITVILTDAANGIVPDKDSIATTGGTVNHQGVGPDNQHPVFVPVEIQGGFITIAATSNPFNLRQAISTVLPSQILSYYSNVIKNSNGNGVIVAVHSSVPLQQFGEHFGNAIIYDALGNIVCRGLKLNVANKSTTTDYGIYWNGMNENGRMVGQGTYLVKVAVVDIKGNESILNLKVGVVASDLQG
jgi:Legume lectin domain